MSNTPMDEGIVTTLSGYTAQSGTSAVYKNVNQKGLRVGVNITSITGGSLTVTVWGRDASGATYTLLQSAALAATAFTELLVYPGCIASTNLVANAPLPPSWGVNWSAASGTIGATVSYATEN